LYKEEATTILVIDIARSSGLTIVGFVQNRKKNVYSYGYGKIDIPESIDDFL
jgi:formate dehydrogenase assembly factor FdhD